MDTAVRPTVPFRRIKRVSKLHHPIVETHCPFCTFMAASTDLRIVEMAELVHHCAKARTPKPLKNVDKATTQL